MVFGPISPCQSENTELNLFHPQASLFYSFPDSVSDHSHRNIDFLAGPVAPASSGRTQNVPLVIRNQGDGLGRPSIDTHNILHICSSIVHWRLDFSAQ